MIYPDYSLTQLEEMADELNRKYNVKRLTEPSTVDVYDIVDLLGARLAFEFLTPDRTYLGATIFRTGTLYVWPGNPIVKGMMPELKLFYGGTIIIDRDLNEGSKEEDHYSENFTVIHECFHFSKHKVSFKHGGHVSMSFEGYNKKQLDKSSAIYHLERQANYASAAFLMPRVAMLNAAREVLGYIDNKIVITEDNRDKVRQIGQLFGVNYTPALYRLKELKVID